MWATRATRAAAETAAPTTTVVGSRSRTVSLDDFDGFTSWGFDFEHTSSPSPPPTPPLPTSPSMTLATTAAAATAATADSGSQEATRRRFGFGGRLTRFLHPGFRPVLQARSESSATVANNNGAQRLGRQTSLTEFNIAERWRQSRALLETAGYDPLAEVEAPLPKAAGVALHFQRSRPLSELFAASG